MTTYGMAKVFSIIVATLSLFATNLRAESPIDFSASDNLKAVYDAGFRPWRATMFTCTITDKTVVIVLPGDGQISLPAQIATFSVLAGDQLHRADFISEVMSSDEAIAKLHQICSALGLSSNGLDQAIPAFANRNSKSSIWNTRGDVGGIAVDATLDRLDFVDHAEAKIYVSLNWKHPGMPPKFPTTPMTPPAGYENVSMVPPGVNPNQQGFPKHDMQYYKDLIAKKKAEEPSTTSPFAPAQPSVTIPAQRARLATETSWWIYAIIALVAVVLLGTWLFLRDRNSKGP